MRGSASSDVEVIFCFALLFHATRPPTINIWKMLQHQGHGMYRWMLPLSWTVPETPCATWGANIGREPEWYAYGEEWPYLVHLNFVRSKCHLDTLDDIDLKAPLTISSTSLLGPTSISSSIQWGFLQCAGGCSIAWCCTIPDHNLCGNRESLLQVFEQVDKCQKWQVFQFCWVFWPLSSYTS